jgi:hypothetical protein
LKRSGRKRAVQFQAEVLAESLLPRSGLFNFLCPFHEPEIKTYEVIILPLMLHINKPYECCHLLEHSAV